MNAKTIVVLVALLLGLGGLATWDEWQNKKDDKEKESKSKVTGIDKPSVTEVKFHSSVADHEASTSGVKAGTNIDLDLVRKDERWWISSPISAKADDSVVNSLLQTIDEFKAEETISTDRSKWKEYGLDTPTRAITLKMPGKDPEKLTLNIGAKVPVGYSVYVSTSQSDKAYLGNQYLLTATSKVLKDFRDKTIATIEPKSVSKVTYKKGSDPEFSVQYKDGTWMISKPLVFAVDNDQMTSFLNDISGLKAEDFLDQPTKDQQRTFLNSKDLVSISWKLNDSNEIALKVSEVDKSFWVTLDVGSLWYKISDTQKSKLIKKPADFRNRKVFAFTAAQIEMLDIDGEIYKKIENKWYPKVELGEGKDVSKALEKSFITSLASDFEYLKTEGFIELQSSEGKSIVSDPPKHHIVISYRPDESSLKEAIVDVWEDKKVKSKCFLRQSNHLELFKVNCSVFYNVKAPAPVNEKSGSLE